MIPKQNKQYQASYDEERQQQNQSEKKDKMYRYMLRPKMHLLFICFPFLYYCNGLYLKRNAIMICLGLFLSGMLPFYGYVAFIAIMLLDYLGFIPWLYGDNEGNSKGSQPKTVKQKFEEVIDIRSRRRKACENHFIAKRNAIGQIILFPVLTLDCLKSDDKKQVKEHMEMNQMFYKRKHYKKPSYKTPIPTEDQFEKGSLVNPSREFILSKLYVQQKRQNYLDMQEGYDINTVYWTSYEDCIRREKEIEKYFG